MFDINIMGNKLILIFFFVLLVLILVYLFFNQKLSADITKNNVLRNNLIERFTNKELNNNNLITNGGFNNKKNVGEFGGSDGINNVVKINNPGPSDYALEQVISDNKTYYKLVVNVDKNQEYNLSFWVRFDQLKSNYIDFKNLVKINTQNNNQINNILDLTYLVEQKLTQSDNNTWYKVRYSFKTDSLSVGMMNIYLNYTQNLPANKVYFTDLALTKVLNNVPNYDVTTDLKVFLDGKQYQERPMSKNWTNMVDTDDHFTWSEKPISSQSDCYLSTKGNILSHKSPKTLLENNSTVQFSIVMVFNGTSTTANSVQSNVVKTESEEQKNNEVLHNAVSISGNNGKSLQLFLPDRQGRIKVVFDKRGEFTKYSDRELVFYNKTIVTMVYANKEVKVYQDGVEVLSMKTEKVYLDNGSLDINADKTWDVNLYDLLIYNTPVSTNDMKKMNHYFFKVWSCEASSDSSGFVNNGDSVSDYDGLFEVDMDNKNLGGYGSGLNDMNYGSNKCQTDCYNMCSPFLDAKKLDSSMDEFNKCRRSCKNTVKSCKSYCSTNKDDSLCRVDDCGTEMIDGGCPIPFDKRDCPKAYKKNGKYTVYIQSKTPFADSMGFSGERSYGYNRENAAAMYKKNFPNCPMPDVLKVGGGKNLKETCPFIIKEGNPCYTTHCENIDWDDPDYINKLSDTCKLNIANYCEVNKDLDENCKCWSVNYRNLEECRTFRRKFADPNDDLCKPGNFNIKEHPDFKKYIRKDAIPCWNCNVP